jgi:hypothetical protein
MIARFAAPGVESAAVSQTDRRSRRSANASSSATVDDARLKPALLFDLDSETAAV